MSDLVFRRIRGRIVPIKKKKESNKIPSVDNTGKAAIAGGTALSIGSSVLAGKFINQSWKAYGRSANIRAGTKAMLNRVPKEIYSGQIKSAAAYKIAGKSMARKGFGLLSFGITAGSALAGYGVNRFKNLDQEQSAALNTAITSGVASAGLYAFSRTSKLKAISKAITSLSKTPVRDFFKSFSSAGKSKTSETIRAYSKFVKTKKPSPPEKMLSKLNKITRKRKRKIDPNQMGFDL